MIARRITVRWYPYVEHPPASVWLLADGRALARWDSGREEIYETILVLGGAYQLASWSRTEETAEVAAPPLPATYEVQLDWAAIHSAAEAVDWARRGTRMGRDGVADAYGGSYSWTAYSTLPDLVRLVHGTDRIARDAWEIVHRGGASRARLGEEPRDVEQVRQACRVAIACARLYDLLHAAGLIRDPSSRICGTGPGYGLTGLRWLAGHRDESEPVSREIVERFAAGEDIRTLLPEVAS